MEKLPKGELTGCWKAVVGAALGNSHSNEKAPCCSWMDLQRFHGSAWVCARQAQALDMGTRSHGYTNAAAPYFLPSHALLHYSPAS